MDPKGYVESGIFARSAGGSSRRGGGGSSRCAGRPLTESEKVEHEAMLGLARARVKAAAWNGAWAEGKAMGFEQAMAYRLSGSY
jgi:hypothetical protein